MGSRFLIFLSHCLSKYVFVRLPSTTSVAGRLLLLVIPLLVILYHRVTAQGHEAAESHAGKNKLTIVMGHAHVPKGVGSEGSKRWLVLPSWGFDYNYLFSRYWSLGIHTDFVVENFELEEHFGEEQVVISRSRPFTSTAVLTYKPGKHVTYLLGGGAEFAPEENLPLIRVGVEYGWELPDAWELGISLMNDFKVQAYNSWVLGLGVSKIF